MNIPPHEWHAASGSYVVDQHGQIWRIAGFIDRPAVCLVPMHEATRHDAPAECRQPLTIVMGSPQSDDFTRLVPQD